MILKVKRRGLIYPVLIVSIMNIVIQNTPTIIINENLKILSPLLSDLFCSPLFVTHVENLKERYIKVNMKCRSIPSAINCVIEKNLM